MLQFVSAHSPSKAISNFELQQVNKKLCIDLVLPSTATLSNISRREYTLTVDPIKKQLPLRNKVSLALDRWTPTNNVAIMSVVAFNIERNWILHEVQLAFDEVDHLCCWFFAS